MSQSTDIEGQNRLQRSIEWLDGHVNYERTGPKGSARVRPFNNDPERRLRHVGRLMEVMDDPHRAFPSIHLTGTNGKTSTSRMITELVLASGLTVGTYTSPHLQAINERISINGLPIRDFELAEVLDSVALYEPMVPKQHDDDTLSYFEILTAAGFRAFADAPVDVGVIEVGVGGTWDSTNVIEGQVSAITNIGLDHAGYLGTTRPEVASHKAGIIKPDSTAVIGEPDTAFLPTWEERRPGRLLLNERDFAVEDNQVAVGGRLVSLHTPYSRYNDLFLPLHGAYQAANAAVAITATEAFFDKPLGLDVVRQGLANVTSPGRMEVVHRQPLVVLDGAHNTAGAQALADTLDESFGADTGRLLVVGMLEGHHPDEILPALQAARARMIFACTAPSPRAIPAAEIAAAAKRMGVLCVVVEDVAAAVSEAMAAADAEELVLVTGSLYVVGAARTALTISS